MDRRKFLAGLLASPILIPVVKHFLPPVNGWPRPGGDFTTENLRYKSTERYSYGSTDIRAFYGSSNGLMTSAAMNAALLPGLKKLWSDEYEKRHDEWEKVFNSNTQWFLPQEALDGYKTAPDAAGRASGLLETQRMAATYAPGERTGYGKRESGILVPRLPRFRKEDTR